MNHHSSPADIESNPPAINFSLVKAHGVAALVTLFLSAIFGALVSLKFNFPDFLGGDAWLTWGRLRYNHTQGIFFGWLGNAFLMFCYYAVPRLADRPVFSSRLGWTLFAIWNFAVVLPGWVLVLAGFSQPLEWAEFPLIVDAFVVLAFLLMGVQFVMPFLRRRTGGLYVSAWYLIGGIVFTTLAYPVGNLVPLLLPGAKGAAFSGLWIHDAVGLFVTPFALAIAYFVIPATTRLPISSHFLSMLGFWGLFFFYPLNGMHHYVFSSIPMDAQKAAIAASAYLGMDVILVVTNLLLSLRQSSGLVGRDLPLRFIWTGVFFYLVVSLQGSLQASMPVNRLTHFTDWVIGHSHLAMIGFATFIAIGGLAHVWQRIPGARCSKRALAWSYWLLLIGLLLMVADLTIAGLVEAHFWQTDLPWMDSVRAARGYWLVRTLTALPLLAAFVALGWSLVSGPRNDPAARSYAADEETAPSAPPLPLLSPVTAASARWFNMAHMAAFVGGVGFFALSFVVLGILPGLELDREIARSAPATFTPLTAAEIRGQQIYGREGCAYCHTQQIRFLEQDVARFGAPTEAWETKLEYPQMWGTRRIGPDLSRAGAIRPDDWQLTHLYNPRLIVRDSVMPGFPWLFQSDPAQPTAEGRDLLAYLKTLGREREAAGYDTKAVNAALAQIASPATPHCAYCAEGALPGAGASRLNGSASLPRRSGTTPLFIPSEDTDEHASEVRHGASVFAQNCATCHGAGGRGDGVGSPSLLPKPANVSAAQFSIERLSQVLWHGVPGSSMPAWRDLPERDLRGLVAFVGALNAPARPESIPPETLAHGATLFAQFCSTCHGTLGDGQSVVAAALAPAPTNFKRKQPDFDHAMSVLKNGLPGTAMPPWSAQLSEADRATLAHYVRSLYAPPIASER